MSPAHKVSAWDGPVAGEDFAWRRGLTGYFSFGDRRSGYFFFSSSSFSRHSICRLELGTIRVQQKKYAEAEPLLLGAYAGLKQHNSTTPETKARLAEFNGSDQRLLVEWPPSQVTMEGTSRYFRASSRGR